MAKNNGLPTPVAVATAIAGLILLPVLLPVSLVTLAWDKRRMQTDARQAICTACGSLLTENALRHAETLWAAHLAQLQRDQPHMRFRLKRPYDVVCLACGQAHKWQSKTRMFVPAQV